MELQPFIEDIRARAGLLTQEEAIGAAEATLETLGEVLENDARQDIATGLPEGLASALRRSQAGQRLQHDEFYERVTEREQQGRGMAMQHAQAVCQALSQALSSEQRSKLRGMVPEDYRYLFMPPASSKSPPGDTWESQATDRVSKPEEVGDIERKGERKQEMAHPEPDAGPMEQEDNEAIRKTITEERSPTPEKSPDSDEGRERRSDK